MSCVSDQRHARLTGKDGKSGLITRVSEGDLGTWGKGEGVNVLLRHVEGDGHGKECSLSLAVDLGESEGVSNATVSFRVSGNTTATSGGATHEV